MADILLEAGTNEVEILVFELDGRRFGVNVAKVREVIRHRATIDVPKKHPSVVGMFEVREHVLTLIDLGAHLGIRAETTPCSKEVPEGDDRSIIVTEFNDTQLGFLIDGVDRIHRLSWSDVMPTPRISAGDEVTAPGLTTGVIAIEDTLVLLVDFESVADSVLTEGRLAIDQVDNELEVDRAAKRVIIVDDSAFMRSNIRKAMLGSGYSRLEMYENGQDAWDAIRAGDDDVDAIVSDIEMPCMDGLHLTRLVKTDPRFAEVPVILFSSLVSNDNAKQGHAVGAIAQVAKPDLADVVRLVDRLVTNRPIDDIISSQRTAA